MKGSKAGRQGTTRAREAKTARAPRAAASDRAIATGCWRRWIARRGRSSSSSTARSRPRTRTSCGSWATRSTRCAASTTGSSATRRYVASPAYEAFWAKLRRGEYETGVYRRLGKNDKEVWILASYSPRSRQRGRAYKVVKIATDVTEQRNRSAEFEGRMNAIDKAQATIEFNLDGTVLTANENFLRLMGYSLDEIRGRHHRVFCEPAYVASADYEAFWAKLRRGEHETGVYPPHRQGQERGVDPGVVQPDPHRRRQAVQGREVRDRHHRPASRAGRARAS